MTAADRLAEIHARADNATDGPWIVEDQMGTDLIVAPSGHAVAYNADDRDIGRPNSEFIAHARADVPALAAALRAVLLRHVAEPYAQGPDYCDECEHLWPCDTYVAVAAALGEAS